MSPDARRAFPPVSIQLTDGTTATLRFLARADGARLARFYVRVPDEDVRFYCPHPLDREHAEKNAAAADDPGQIVQVIIDADDEIAGYAWVRGAGDTGSFGLCVRRDFQGRGAGGRLVARLFEIVDAVGPTVVRLTVQEANPAAVKLYQRTGFRVVQRGLRRGNPACGIPEEPQFWMERVLPPVCELRGTVRICVEDSENRTSGLATKAADLLCRGIRERTGLNPVEDDSAPDIVLRCAPELGPEAYRIAGAGRQVPVRIEAADGRGLIYGVGRFLREAELAPRRLGIGTWRGTSAPVNPVRAMYFASHFHNWYHIAPLPEVARYVEDLALYGCNCLSVWFDLHHYTSIDAPDAQAMLERLRAILAAANRVGMGASLTMLANEGFTSTPPELKATNAAENGYHRRPGGFYDTEVCPSQPGGMDLILANRDAVLKAFAGIEFDYVWIWPYDQGGCTCAKCAPWGANGFVRTAKPVAELIKRHFSKAKIVLATWYFDRFIDGEWARFDAWVQRERPTWFDYLLIDGFGAFPEYPLLHGVPGGFPVVGFPEISMEGNSPWGGYGANPRPRHWREYWARSKAVQRGNFPYSEGIYEDINKFLMLQLNWSPDRDVDSILREYASGWFGRRTADALVAVFELMEQDESTAFGRVNVTGDAGEERPAFTNRTGLPHAEACERQVQALDDELPEPVRQSWRWRLIRLRARIDAQLKASGLRFNDTLEADFAELARIYYADRERTRACVLPPCRPLTQ